MGSLDSQTLIYWINDAAQSARLSQGSGGRLDRQPTLGHGRSWRLEHRIVGTYYLHRDFATVTGVLLSMRTTRISPRSAAPPERRGNAAKNAATGLDWDGATAPWSVNGLHGYQSHYYHTHRRRRT